ncbi:beta-1,4-N-acetylgalactosaminyltransferase 3-like [Trichomycterus rosablanca]|uniref:beta-1,4-N-acetylgalactosaminyltransferase 3-like n=1 Tax=Trichomycterus rosablanca TaxID=2290929 RepID=UPI002F350AAD
MGPVPPGNTVRKKQAADQPQWKPEFMGEVNMHVFEDWCGGSVDHLKKNELFPLLPHTRTTIKKLAVHPRRSNYGLRIFGYIHPSVSGEYIFAIASDKNSEFWLSDDESIKNIKLLAYLGKTGTEWTAPGEFEKFASQLSQPVRLAEDKRYFFEIIYKQSKGMDHMEAAWRLNNDSCSFEIISANHLSLYADETFLLSGNTDHIPLTAANKITGSDVSEVDMIKEDPRDLIFKIPLVKESDLQGVFPECNYKPLYLFDNPTIERYDGINYVRYSSVYPNDHTRLSDDDIGAQLCFYKKDETYTESGGFVSYLDLEDKRQREKGIEPETPVTGRPDLKQILNVRPVDFHSKQNDFVIHTCNRTGNIIMLRKEVMPVVKSFMRRLQSKPDNDLILKRVLNVEKKANSTKGYSRYLLELEMENGQGQNVLISKYFYATSQKTNEKLPALCSPKDFSWNPEAKVSVIMAVKNQGRWVKHFIKEMENIYRATGDKNFDVIIVDFSSIDINVEEELKKADLPSYKFKRLHRNFGRSPGLQAAIELIEDDNSILFLCDLHLHFPVSIIDSVRKHCVPGKMVFAPVLMRLNCGATMQDPKGFWETQGYGLVGIYKTDIDRIGGMNTKEFTDKWGGEDWELLDRIVLHKLEVERLSIRNFLHFFHSKQGMWNTA